MIDDTPIIHCPLPGCGEVMIYDRRHAFWACPRCGTEVWKDGAKLAAREEEATENAIEAYRQRQVERAREVHRRKQAEDGALLWSIGLPAAEARSLSFAGTAKHGGSKKSGKRRKRQKKQAALRRYEAVENTPGKEERRGSLKQAANP